MTTPPAQLRTQTSRGDVQEKDARLSKIIAITLCLIPAIYFLAMLCFALFHAEDYASATPQLIRYVIAPGLFVVLLIGCAFFVPTRISTTIGGIFIGILGGFFAFETLLTARMFASLMGMVSVPQQQWLNQEGATSSLPPAYTLLALNNEIKTQKLDKAVLSGSPHQRVLMCANYGKPVFYTSDRYGFNNPDSAYKKKTSILILGDSFVEGICLPPQDNMVSDVRKSGAATIGMGMRGGGPLLETAMLGRFGPLLRPRHVMMVFYEGNDWENLKLELQTPWLREALQPKADFGPISRSPDVQEKEQKAISEWVQEEMPGFLEVVSKTHMLRNFFALHETGTQLGIGYPKAALPKPEYLQILQQAQRIISAWGGELTIVYLPQGSRFEGLIPSDFVHDQRRTEVYKATQAAGLNLIDLTPAYQKMLKHMPIYADDGHLSSEGAQLTASILLNHLPNIEKSADIKEN